MCYNVYKVSVSDVEMLDLQKENVEVLAALKLKETKKSYLCCTSCQGICDYGRRDVFKSGFQY